jgi:hypothetical protein
MQRDEFPMAGRSQVDYMKAALLEIAAIMHNLIELLPRRIPKNKWPVIALYLSIAETVDSVALLFNNGRLNQIPALQRGIVDSLFDLELLSVDLENVNILTVKALSEQIKRHHLRIGPDSSNSELKNDPARVAKIKEELANAQRMVDGLKAKGFTVERYTRKYETLGAKYFKGIVFSTLSGEAHNGIDVLLRRHIEKASDSKLLYKYQAEQSIDDYRFAFFNISMAALHATSVARKLLDIDFRDPLGRMVSVTESQTGKDLHQFDWYEPEG